MQIVKTYKFKLCRSKKNKALYQRIDMAGIIWNHSIALHRRYYKLTGKGLNMYALQKHIAKLKRLPKYSHWSLVDAQATQDIAQRIDKSYKLFFGNLKRKVRTSPPGFKKVKRYTSFTLKQTGWKLLDGNKVRIQGVVYKFSKSRDIAVDVKTVTVKRDTLGNLSLYFVVQKAIDQINQAMTGNSAGFDFGMKTFLVPSIGDDIDSPLYFREAMAELKTAQQNLARKVKFSGGWQKARQIVTRIHQRVVNKRRDWFFKLAHRLTDTFDQLFFEDLSMKGMQALWGRKISDRGALWARSEFMGILDYVASTKGKIVHLIDRFYPSSKTCSDCGHVYHELKLSEREWACKGCGVSHDRDRNAAINIHREGTQRVPASLRLGDVRPASSAGAHWARRLTLESHGL